jgi:peptide-methionine (R)-S-oxide reductase
MKRRDLLRIAAAAPILLVVARTGRAARPAHDETSIEALRRRWRDSLPPGYAPPDVGDRVERSRSDWQRRLEPLQFDVLREQGTERAFTSPLNDEKRTGIFACAGCDLPLFTSAMKYDSGTGWPSFFTTIPGVFGTQTDWKLLAPRTEYHCLRCGGHHGHVFDDGPPPTGERWCNNGVALRFLPRDG